MARLESRQALEDLSKKIASERDPERRAIAVSDSAGSTILVGSGLAAGERVVVEGPATLADGDPVRERKG